MKILILGTGAVGSFYGSLLARQGATVAVVARADYPVVHAHGIHVHSEAGLGDYHFRPATVLAVGETPDSPFDYVLVCTKMVAGVDRVGLLQPVLGAATRIVLIANGVDIEAEVAEAFPHNPLISGLAFVCVSRTAPGQVRHQSQGRLVLGDFPAGVSEQTRSLVEAFRRGGIRCQASADIIMERWQKCVWNAAFNPLSVLCGGLDTAALLATEEPQIRAIMTEICRVAAALAHPLPTDLVDKMIENTRAMPPYQTSMLLDFAAGRPLETEAIVGNAVRAGRRAGIPVPRLEAVYAAMTATPPVPPARTGNGKAGRT